MKLEDNIQNAVVTERKVLFFIKDFICTETYRRLFQTKNYIEKWNIITLWIDVLLWLKEHGELVVGNLRQYKICKSKVFFFAADLYWKRKIIVTGKLLTFGDVDGILVSCLLKVSGQRHKIEILKQQINDRKK